MLKNPFTEEIDTVHFPVIPDLNGEVTKAIENVIKSYDLPKIHEIQYIRTIRYDEEYPIDSSEVIIKKAI